MTSGVLQDRSGTGRERPWREHKMANEMLALAYEGINPDKARRLLTCATRLSFARSPDSKRLTLAGAWFCRVRLCPMCSWRRSLKVAAQMHAIMGAIREERPMAYVLLTLTRRNCTGEGLDSTITQTLRAFSNLTKRKEWQRSIKGYYRAMEITHNLTDDTYHPHIHAVLAVTPSYFKSRYYIAQGTWTDLWREAAGLDYEPIVDVRRIKGDTASAVAEVAKYAVKSADYLIPDDWDMTVSTVRLLDAALHNRRFIGFGGVFKETHRKLRLDDPDSGDLIKTDTEPTPHTADRLISFAWYSGYRQYRQDE